MRWHELNINLRGKTAGQIKTRCPQCSEGRRNKRDTSLSVDITAGVFHCHHCGWRGSANTHSPRNERKSWAIPEYNNTPLGDKTLEWFLDRGISKASILRMKITEENKFMPQAGKERNCIRFNYFRGGQLVNIKYRDGEKHFIMHKDAELILYGLELIEGQETAIITEGEMDMLSFYEAGLTAVVSVPNGAPAGHSRLEYMDNCWQELEGKKQVFLATDADEPGFCLREELARRLGKERCWIISYPEGCKDANEVLIKHGAKSLRECFEKARPYPLEGIYEVADLEEEIEELFRNGFPKGLKIQHRLLDEHISWRTGEMTVITGIPNSGKSEFMDDVYLRLAALHGWKFGIFSPENHPTALHFAKLAEKYTGESFYHRECKMSRESLQRSRNFLQDHFSFVRADTDDLSLDYLLQKARELVFRKGINAFVIDPWNRIEHAVPPGMNETQYINEALTKIYNFKTMNDIHLFLVAHPRKMEKDKSTLKFSVPNLYDISGSSHFFNKTDNGLCVHRDFSTNATYVHIQKIRWKFMGRLGVSKFDYEVKTGRYKEIEEQEYRKW